ncbi:MAG: lycopene cyclase family protein [Fodinibius sp.]|nr:lycopene cyclase family protein [Fodinibius sp.]
MQNHYDYIIAGAGAAGLSLAWRLLQSNLAKEKVLIIDSDLTPVNDKTWCFWDADTPPFADLIHKKWTNVEVGTTGDRFSQALQHYPYYCYAVSTFSKKSCTSSRLILNLIFWKHRLPRFYSANPARALPTPKNRVTAQNTSSKAVCRPGRMTKTGPTIPCYSNFPLVEWEIELHEPLLAQDTFTLMDFDQTFDEGIGFIYHDYPGAGNRGLIECAVSIGSKSNAQATPAMK